MKYYFLITGLDLLTGNVFHPGTCLFRTEKEANKYIKTNTNKTVKYAKKRVMVGKMS